jgi:hypothetical protein
MCASVLEREKLLQNKGVDETDPEAPGDREDIICSCSLSKHNDDEF